MVARHTSPPFTFTCFTDNDAGMRPEVQCAPLPDLDVEMPTGTKGIWPKARLWSEQLGDLHGPVLFLDLDLVITGPLDSFFNYGDPEDVILARNQSTPFEKLGQTSIYRFPVGKLAGLKERFLADPQAVADTYQFEQRFVTREAPGGIKFWPRGWVLHFRIDCIRQFPLNYVLPPRLPPDARVVIFPGGLQPPDAIAGRWGKRQKPGGRLAHIMRVFDKDRHEPPLRHLRHYLPPVDWVEEAWRED